MKSSSIPGNLNRIDQIKYFLLWLAMIAIATSCSQASTPAARETPARSSQQLQDIAQTVVDQLGKRDYSAVFTRFDGPMQSMLPEPKLKESWEQLITQAGSYEKQTGLRVDERQGRQIVTVTCQFEKGRVAIQLGFNDAAQITGLYFSNAG